MVEGAPKLLSGGINPSLYTFKGKLERDIKTKMGGTYGLPGAHRLR